MKLNVERRFFAFLLAIVLILPILPLHVFAVEHLNTTVLDGKIKVYTDGVSGQGSGKNEDGTITVTTTATVKCSGMSYSYTANAHTIWVENNTTDETLMVDFDYEATRLGSLTIDGVAKNATPSGNCSKSLAPGEKIEIVITSPATGSSNSGATSTINLSNFTLKDTSSKSVTVVPATGGTIKVNGTAITANKTVSTDYATGVTLVATPASGYAFIGWGDTAGNVLATTATYLHQPLADITISALFAPKSETTGYWLANGKVHNDLNEACAAAQVGDKMVVLLKDATLPAGTYTIPADVYVIIPHNEANDFYGKEPPLSSNGKKWTAPTLYRTLTLAKDAKLVINGTLELPAQHHVSSGSSSVKYGGAIDGAYSLMLLSEGSNVTVNGTLYAWGMISGAGTVDLYGTAYEKMQVNDYRGGAATSALVTTYGDNKLFPFSQYYVQNIESKMTIYYGASLNVNAGVYLSAAEQASVEFVGDTGMFQLAEGSYVTKQYDAANDRLVIDLYGNASLSSITLYFGGQNVNSSGFRMGINNNISIHVHSGVTTISQELVLQPGVQVTIDRTATLYNTTNVFVMDAEDWGTFARGEVLMPVKWTYANGATVKRTSVTDAIVDINGIVINGGQLFSTGSDSIISSGKTGVYALLVPATGSATLYQLDHNSFTLGFTNNWVTISCTSAVLVNGDKTTVKAEGSQYDAFIYDSIQNKWVQKNIYNGGAGYTATLTYDVNGGTGSVGSTTMDFFTQAAAFMGSNYTAMAPYSFAVTTQIPTHPNGYTFLGWSTDKDADVPMYGYQGDEYITISADSTLYAVWGIPKFEITWIVNGETYIVEVESGKTPEYPYGTPTKSSDSTNHYTFTGWNTPPVAVTGPATYTAVFSGEAHDKDKIEGGRHYCSVCNYNMGNCSDTDPTDHMCDNGGEQMVCCADYLTPTDGKDPTCTEAGWKDYYTCSCGKLYADAEAKTEITLESWKTGDGKLDMSGHKGTIVYTNNGETHSAVYSECGCVVVTGEAHSYENGECVCDKVQTFTVTWIADGKTVDTETVEYGKNTTKNPTIPAKAGYSAAWDKTATNVTSNVTITAVYTVNEYTITWVVDGKSTTETYAYGATPSFKGSTDKAADAQYTYTFKGWDEDISEVQKNVTYTAIYSVTGFVNTDIGYVYKLEDEVQKTGWTEIGDAWYYLDHTTGVRAEGVTRVPYPTVEINGITYACPETDASDKFIDYSSALFVFDADGKFQQTTGIIYDKEGMPQHYAVNGMIPWHYGLATDGTDYYYFIGDTENGGNKLDSGDVYLTKSNNLTINGKTVIFKGVYTFGADGKLCFYDGVTKVGEDLRYYYDYCYTAKSGLIAVEDHGETKYIYVRSSTAKLVANAEYWVPANVYNIVPGYYVFSADGYLTGIEYTTKNGIFYENGGYYYYVDGAKYYAGLIQYNGTASDGTEYNDAYIYVRSNGQLAIGQYWITRSNGLMETKTYLFNECGIMDIRDGIVEENGSLYFYVDGVLAKGKGLVKIDENYYYVRSSGEVVNNSDYWITNTNEYDIVAKIYTFDENGVMIEPESKEADLTGVVDGYYFINGEIQYGVGPIIWEGNIYYVRSNGMVATGKYWTTTSNEILPSGRYTFDETGKLITE